MKTYKVSYSGNSTKFNSYGSLMIVYANSEREAVENLYRDYLDTNYFPQEDGSIQDCDGYTIAGPDDVCIEYDGGYLTAEEETFDVIFDDDDFSDEKGFALSYKECKQYIDTYNGTNESYFADYKSGTVSIVSNITGETEFITEVF